MPTKQKARTPAVHTPHPENQLGLERLIFFSDAVFAIAITLLVLEIRLPTSEGPATNAELLARLLSIWPHYLGYVLSFLVIGTFWMGHHRKYGLIQRYDGNLLLLNLLMLMWIAFIPFPTALISEYGNRTATIFYALTIAATGVMSATNWWYAAYHNRLVNDQLSARLRRREFLKPLLISALFLCSVGVAFIDDDWAKFSWLLMIPIIYFVRRS